MATFGPKPSVNPLQKSQIFDFLKILFLQSRKTFFFLVLEYRKTHFPGLYCPKKKVGKIAIFVPKLLVNPFGKMSIFRLFLLLDFIGQKSVFSLQNIVKDIFVAYMEKWPFLDQNHGLTPLQICQFFDFMNFLVLQSRKAFFFLLEYRKTLFSGLYRLKKKKEKWPFLDQNKAKTIS